MALLAGLYHRRLSELLLAGNVLHDYVAIGARQTAIVMGAPLPEQAVLPLVTSEADGVPLYHGRGVVLTKTDHSPDAPAAPRIHVGLARTVTALAPLSLQRGSRVLEKETPHPRLGEILIEILMALRTRLRANVARLGGGPLDARLGGRSR